MNKSNVITPRFLLSFNPSIIASFLFIATMLAVTGCNSVDAPPTNESDAALILTVDDVESVEAMSVIGKSGVVEYQLQVKLKPSRKRSRIKALQMLAQNLDQKSVFLVDDGSGSDTYSNDGIYSARVPANCIPVKNRSSSLVISGKELGLECKINFVGPGEKCDKWNDCPSRVERSILWGLIKYETDIVVCFCLEECTITI